MDYRDGLEDAPDLVRAPSCLALDRFDRFGDQVGAVADDV